MFGFSEVKTHLGVVFNDTFGLFEGFLVGFLEKWTKSAKSGKMSGSYAAA